MDQEREREQLNRRLQRIVYEVLHRSPEVKSIIEELSSKGYQATIGILIGLLQQRTTDGESLDLSILNDGERTESDDTADLTRHGPDDSGLHQNLLEFCAELAGVDFGDAPPESDPPDIDSFETDSFETDSYEGADDGTDDLDALAADFSETDFSETDQFEESDDVDELQGSDNIFDSWLTEEDIEFFRKLKIRIT